MSDVEEPIEILDESGKPASVGRLEKEMARRTIGRRCLDMFIDYTFDGYVFSEWQKELFQAMKEIDEGTLKFLVVEICPRSGKTQIISRSFPAFLLGGNPTRQIVGVSYSAELATKNAREAKKIVLSEEFKCLFPDFQLSSEKREGGYWETYHGGSYYSTGVGGALTGFGFDIGFIDDFCKNREEAESPTMREKVWDWYTSTFLTRKQGEHAAVIVLGTRWHDDDLIGRIKKQASDQGREIRTIVIPALDENDESFFPERFSTKYYKQIRDEIGVRDFSALYQQDPILSMDATFKKSTFQYYALSDDDIDPKKKDFEVAIFCDPAFSTHKMADDMTCMAVARHRKTGEFYELDRFSERIPPSMGCVVPVNMALKWKSAGWFVRFISVEEMYLSKKQTLFVNQVDEEMKKARIFIPLRRYVPKVKKEDRIRFHLEPVVSRGAWHFRIDDQGNRAWAKGEEQLLKFPTGVHDDIPDCMNQAVEMFEKEYPPAQRGVLQLQQELYSRRVEALES